MQGTLSHSGWGERGRGGGGGKGKLKKYKPFSPKLRLTQ